MKYLFAIIHHDSVKDRYYCSFQNNSGDVLAESIRYDSEAECDKARQELLKKLEEYVKTGREPQTFRCANYYYCAICDRYNVPLLRCDTRDSRGECIEVWKELIKCASGSVFAYDHTGDKSRLRLELDEEVMSYMYSLDGRGWENNFLNYTDEVQWENPESWLWKGEEERALYYKLFQRMPKTLAPKYRIVVRTGDVPKADTRAKVYITLIGQRATLNGTEMTTSQEFLLENHYNKAFAIAQLAASSGKREPGKGSQQWLEEAIKKREEEKNKSTGQIVLSDELKQRIEAELRSREEGRRRVSRPTDRTDAVKNAQERKITAVEPISPSNFAADLAFGRGQKTVFHVEVDETIGDLKQVIIRHDNSGSEPEWYLKDVEVIREKDDRSWYFPCDDWLSRTEEADNTTRTLKPGIKPECEHYYDISLDYGERKFHGKNDGNVYVTLYGTSGTWSRKLDKGLRQFSDSGTETFRLFVTEILGALTRVHVLIRVADQGEEAPPTLELRDVRVRNETTRASWYFPKSCAHITPEGTKKSKWILVSGPASADERVYAVHVKTGSKLTAGTAAKVSITLHGSKGSSETFKLNTPDNDFVTGNLDTFRIAVNEELGDLQRIDIGHNNFGLWPGWYLEHVHIEKLTADKCWHFPCNRWFSKRKDDGAIQRTLMAVPEGKEEAVYRIGVHTADVRNAGTNEKVFITLLGTDGSSGEYQLDSFGDDFRQGKWDYFTIHLPVELGEIRQIRMRHDCPDKSNGWYLQEVLVELVGTERSWYFDCDRWLKKEAEEDMRDLFLDRVPGGSADMLYKLHVRTGDISGAGTDARVFVTLIGEQGSSYEYRLATVRNDFRRGKTEEFRISVPRELGELTQLRIRHDSTGVKPEWYLKDVLVERVKSERSWYFDCDRWLDRKQDDGSTDLLLDAVPGGRQEIWYEVQVRTGDIKGAGTDARVYVTLVGALGESHECRLDTWKNNFRKGKTEMFRIPALKELGELERIRIRHDGFGFGAAWYLEEIQVLRESSGEAAYFPCGRWLDEKMEEGSTELTLERAECDPLNADQEGGGNA